MPARFWVDMGSSEGDTGPHDLDPGVAEARRAFNAALSRGLVVGRDVAYLEAVGFQHNETAWRQRLPSILGFLLSDEGFSSLPGDESLVLLPSGQGLYLGGRPHILFVAELQRGGPLRPFRMTLPRSALTASGPVTFDADQIVTASAPGQATLAATWSQYDSFGSPSGHGQPFGPSAGGSLTEASLVLPIFPIGVAPVIFEVQVPTTTPEGATIYLSGDVPELGAGDPAGIALGQPRGRRARSAELALPVATPFHYRYTLGSEETVETDANGYGVALRSGGPIPQEGALIVDLVRGWKSAPAR